MYCKPGDIFIHCPRTAFVTGELETKKNRALTALITDVIKIQDPQQAMLLLTIPSLTKIPQRINISRSHFNNCHICSGTVTMNKTNIASNLPHMRERIVSCTTVRY